ncbi:hypothetical protein MCW_01579 [Cardidatus Bartonella washoeensis 085-0475]|uniref:Uncharacterized protein n=1 Tax=Cardidatus Bartonella washoeensis 085-0475 TaxID=1094564 RepID=J1JFP3_9HYPH|nr:hypothetical protein MCW_01579 [Bartonella washoeensis 085-0475]
MYKYEIKPTLCSQLVLRNTHNLGELCITISGDKGEPYVDTIISKDKVDAFLSEDNVVQMELKKSQCFTFSYEFRPFACTGFEMIPPNSDESFILTLYSDHCAYVKLIPIDRIVQPIKTKL